MTTDTETLATLIRDFKGRRSYPDLGKESGPGLGWKRWQQLGDPAFGMATTPKPETVKTIARVLRVTERRVWDAIGRSEGLDIDTEESPFLARMVARTSALSDKQQDLLLEMIGEFVDLQLTIAEMQEQAATEKPVRHLKAARKTTGAETRGPRGGARTR